MALVIDVINGVTLSTNVSPVKSKNDQGNATLAISIIQHVLPTVNC